MRWWPFRLKPQFEQTYVPEQGMAKESRLRESLSDDRWDRLPLPPRRHECWPQTRVVSRTRTTYRCPCGAWSPDKLHWLNRNSRRRKRHRL